MPDEEKYIIRPNEARLLITVTEAIAGQSQISFRVEGFTAPNPTLLRCALIKLCLTVVDKLILDEQQDAVALLSGPPPLPGQFQ